MPRFLLIAVFLLVCIRVDAESWKVDTASIQVPIAEQNVLTLKLLNSTGREKVITAKLPIMRIKEFFTYNSSAVVTGSAGNSDLVAIFDIGEGQLDSWFFCYSPTRLFTDRIVYTEWYPNHSSDSFNDVVLIYDLNGSKEQNMLESAAKRDRYPFRFGLPVYPEWNVKHHWYKNVVDLEAGQIYSVTSPFAALSDDRLCFVGEEGESALTAVSKLVVVELPNAQRTESKLVDIVLPLNQLKMRGANRDTVKVTGIQELPANQVRLLVPKWDYGVSQIVTSIPVPSR